MNKVEESEIEAKLKGKTFQVYWYMLRSGGSDRSFGVREIQRALRFKSPSVALYHLEKLREIGLLVKTSSGEYKIAKEVKIGLLKLFIRIGRFRLPRFLLYAIFTTTLLVSYIVLYPQTLTYHNLIALLFGVVTSVIFWYETIRAYREIP